MSNEQLSALQAYVDDALLVLGLGGWRVTVIRDSTSEHHATIDYYRGRREANLEVAGDFFERVPRSQREIVAHELAHLVFSQLEQYSINEDTETLLGGPAFAAYRAGWLQHLELAVDQLEQIFAGLLAEPVLPLSPARPDERHDFREPSA